MRTYKVNFIRRIKELVPYFFKGQSNSTWTNISGLFWITPEGNTWDTNENSRQLAWLESLLAPLKVLNEDLLSFVEDTRFLLNLNGQTNYLQEHLNRLFDPAYFRIEIQDGTAIQPIYIFNKSEGQPPVYMFNKSEGQPPIYMYNKSEYSQQYDFIICIPDDLDNSSIKSQIRAVVERYKLAGMRFNVTTC